MDGIITEMDIKQVRSCVDQLLSFPIYFWLSNDWAVLACESTMFMSGE
jgi:hypothetical protein